MPGSLAPRGARHRGEILARAQAWSEVASCSLLTQFRVRARVASSRLERRPVEKGVHTMKSRGKSATKRAKAKTDWSRFDAMTDEQVEAAARKDPDARPLTETDLKRMKRMPQAKVIRRALDLSQEEFAECFGIPIGTLRDWEQGRVEPDQAARSYLKVIARNPDAVREALKSAA